MMTTALCSSQGNFKGWMSIPCTRCLGIARLSLDGAFDAMLLKRTNAKRHIKPKVDSEQDLEVNFDDLDVGFYEGQNSRYRYDCS